jgi:pyruvate kinase
MIAWSVHQAVNSLSPIAVVVPTHSGSMARNVTRFRLPVWITALSTEPATCQALQFSYGIEAIQVDEDQADWTPYLRDRMREQGYRDGVAILTQGPSTAFPCGNNRLEIVNLAL